MLLMMCDVLSALPSMTVFDKNNLRVQFALERDTTDPLALNITLTATNGSAVAINDFVFQAAVPKVQRTFTNLLSTVSILLITTIEFIELRITLSYRSLV